MIREGGQLGVRARAHVVNGDKLMSCRCQNDEITLEERKMAKNELRLRPYANREGDRSCCSLKVVKCCVLLFNSILLVSETKMIGGIAGQDTCLQFSWLSSQIVNVWSF